MDNALTYLAQFAHVDCGGQPVPFPALHEIRCAACGYCWPWLRTLQEAVQANGLKSLVVKEKFL